MKYFTTPITQHEVDEAAMYHEFHGTSFDKAGWDYIVQELGGNLPVEIRAVKEGTVVPTGNVLFTIESTDERVYWVVSWLETVLMTVWYMSNVSTRSYYVRQLLTKYAETTQDNPFVDYQYHNFGARGSTNPEAAQEGGVAHLMAGFMGSDNFATFQAVQNYYPVKDLTSIMHSINATEHSSTTAWGRDQEMDMIMNHLEINKGKDIIAAVCDSYDYFKCTREICDQNGMFQKKINSDEYPVFVMRPDSGNPKEIISWTLDMMEEENVPFTVNDKGYKVFNKMRIIWGDGINEISMEVMLDILLLRGYSSENIAFGSGGWLMQQHDRDTQGWAVKCSEITLKYDGAPSYPAPYKRTREVYKDPITAPNKKSKKGKVTLWYNHATDEYFTDSINFKTNDFPVTDMLNTVYKNGKMTRVWSLADIREQSK